MKITFCWDDGAPEDLKLIELHRKNDIPGIFFVPSENREGREVLTSKDIMDNYDSLITFGGHTQHHTYLTDIPETMIEQEVLENKQVLEDILGEKIEHFCLPGGRYNSIILQTVLQHFQTCRTAETMNFSPKGEIISPSFHFYPRGMKSVIGNLARHKEFQTMLKVVTSGINQYFELLRYITDIKSSIDDSQIIIWGHSWELEKFGLWNELDSYMKYVNENYRDSIIAYCDLK